MPERLKKRAMRVVGVRQTLRAVKEQDAGIPVRTVATMEELARMCRVDVPSAAAGVLDSRWKRKRKQTPFLSGWSPPWKNWPRCAGWTCPPPPRRSERTPRWIDAPEQSNLPDTSKAGQAFDFNPQDRLRRSEERL